MDIAEIIVEAEAGTANTMMQLKKARKKVLLLTPGSEAATVVVVEVVVVITAVKRVMLLAILSGEIRQAVMELKRKKAEFKRIGHQESIIKKEKAMKVEIDLLISPETTTIIKAKIR